MLAMQSKTIDSVKDRRACAWGVVGCCSILPHQLLRPLTIVTTIVPDRSPNPSHPGPRSHMAQDRVFQKENYSNDEVPEVPYGQGPARSLQNSSYGSYYLFNNRASTHMRPSSDGFLRFCHEALWSLLRATKRHKAACGFCFRHPVGTLKSRGLWSRGQHRPHKIRRGTVDGSCLCIFGD